MGLALFSRVDGLKFNSKSWTQQCGNRSKLSQVGWTQSSSSFGKFRFDFQLKLKTSLRPPNRHGFFKMECHGFILILWQKWQWLVICLHLLGWMSPCIPVCNPLWLVQLVGFILSFAFVIMGSTEPETQNNPQGLECKVFWNWQKSDKFCMAVFPILKMTALVSWLLGTAEIKAPRLSSKGHNYDHGCFSWYPQSPF